MKRLIVTADDLGLSTERDSAILEAYDRGIVTSTSLIVGGPTWKQALTAALERPNLSVGLHLCFVQGQSVLSPSEIPSLVDSDGSFPASVLHLIAKQPEPRELILEANAQMRAFMDVAQKSPDFVNTHQHAQLVPRVLDAVIEVCRKYSVQKLRLPAEQNPLRPNSKARSWLWPLATGAALWSRRDLRRAGLSFPDRMLGGPESGQINTATLNRLLDMLASGTTELVVHPTHQNAELAALTQPGLENQLSRSGVERISFNAL